MKRKIGLILSILLLVVSLTACTSSKEAVSSKTEDSLKQGAELLLTQTSALTKEQSDELEKMSDNMLELSLVQNGFPSSPENFKSLLESWQAAVKECGKFKSFGEYSFEKDKDEYKVYNNVTFANRNAKLTMIFDSDLKLQSTTIDGDYTQGEILKKAGMNTLLGMGTVFIVLIFLAVFFSIFGKAMHAIEKRRLAGLAAKEPVVETNTAPTPAAYVEDVTDDSEIMAVITAAISAYESENANEPEYVDGFFVRSIKRRKNRW
ncbi:MAG: OadG family protein [Lachnospiraceae bacterium]|nr:OadG family protein [Lachnospiraceae bacterium]